MKAAKIIAVWVVFAAILLSIFWGFHKTDDVQIPIRNDMERSVLAKISAGAIILSIDASPDGAHVLPEELFLNLVPENATIYFSFIRPDANTLKKVYWTIIVGEKSGYPTAIAYEDTYKFRGYQVKKYTGDTVFFHYDNFFNDWLGFVLFIAFIFGFCVVFWLCLLIIGESRKDKKGAA